MWKELECHDLLGRTNYTRFVHVSVGHVDHGGDVWKGFGLKLVGMDAYIETLCWANYIRDMERKEVTVQNLRQKISDVSYILCKPSEHPYPERMFPRHLNYQKPRESADEYGKPIDPVLRQQLRERSKNAVPSATHWGGRVALELPQLNTI